MRMERRIRLLGVAPYEGMEALMQRLAGEYPQVELTSFVGDMEQGLEAVRSSFHGNYDALISRGGTARMLQEHLTLPVIEIEVSAYDVLCALKLSDDVAAPTAMVAFANITNSARQLCELMGRPIEIVTIDSPEEVEPTLLRLRERRFEVVLCDAISHAAARRLGMNSFLIASGADSVRRAFEQAVRLYDSQAQLWAENRFFKEVIQGQVGQTVVFDDRGRLFLSSIESPSPRLLALLRGELEKAGAAQERRILRNMDGMLYSIRSRRVEAGGLACTAFFFTAHRSPLSPRQMGIRFLTREEVGRIYDGSLLSLDDGIADYRQDLDRINRSEAPVMITGEDGTGKEPMACALYVQGALSRNPFVAVNCSLLTERSWSFLTERHSSPLYGEACTLYFSNLDALSPERLRQLLAILSDMEVCRQNRVLLSCACRQGEYASEVGSLFMDRLCCLSLCLRPLRETASRIPLLLSLLLNRLNADLPRPILGASPEALRLLQEFPWPHNATQFRRVVGELAVTAQGRITAEDVRRTLGRERHVGMLSPNAENASTPLDLNRTLEEINRDVALRVLEEAGGNRTAAAGRLGISRTTLWRMIRPR